MEQLRRFPGSLLLKGHTILPFANLKTSCFKYNLNRTSTLHSNEHKKQFYLCTFPNSQNFNLSVENQMKRNKYEDYEFTLHCPQSEPSVLALQTQSPVSLSHRLELLTVPRESQRHTAIKDHRCTRKHFPTHYTGNNRNKITYKNII